MDERTFNPMQGLKNMFTLGGSTDAVQPPTMNYTPTDYVPILSKLPKVRAAVPGGVAGTMGKGLLGAAPIGFMGKAFGHKRPDGTEIGGWAIPALAAAGTLMDGFMGMKQYGLAKDSFKQSKKEFEMNYDTQRRLTNAQLEDQHRARSSGNPSEYLSVSDYMNKFGVK